MKLFFATIDGECTTPDMSKSPDEYSHILIKRCIRDTEAGKHVKGYTHDGETVMFNSDSKGQVIVTNRLTGNTVVEYVVDKEINREWEEHIA